MCLQHMNGSLLPSTRMTFLSAVCEALPEVVAGSSASAARCNGVPTLLNLVLRALAAADTAGALLLLRLPCILARVTDQLINANQVLALIFGPLVSTSVLCPASLPCITEVYSYLSIGVASLIHLTLRTR